MSDAAHKIPGQTSDFEFRLLKTSDQDSSSFPISGKYTGWFMLQQPPPRSTIKVEDKEINIRFSVNDDESSSDYSIEGEGFNRFGRFKVHGVLSEEGDLQMYRVYSPKSAPSPAAKNKSKPQFKATSRPSIESVQAPGASGSVCSYDVYCDIFIRNLPSNH